MIRLIEDLKNASPKTKNFILTCFIYGFIIIISTVYCFARLDFVRSNRTSPTQTEGSERL